MNIVEVDRIERDGVMAEVAKLGFLLAPVLLVAPIINEGAKILKIGAVVPSGIGLIHVRLRRGFPRRPLSVLPSAAGPEVTGLTNLLQPTFQIGECLVRYVDTEGLRLVAHRFQRHLHLPVDKRLKHTMRWLRRRQTLCPGAEAGGPP